jgi:hypothetical protein
MSPEAWKEREQGREITVLLVLLFFMFDLLAAQSMLAQHCSNWACCVLAASMLAVRTDGWHPKKLLITL